VCANCSWLDREIVHIAGNLSTAAGSNAAVTADTACRIIASVATYGQDHGFRIDVLPVMYVGGQRRFQYGGYWFGLVDPWPESWSDG
jgi:hypothetical protein